MEKEEKWCLAIHKDNFNVRFIQEEKIFLEGFLEKLEYQLIDFVFYKLRDNMEYRSFIPEKEDSQVTDNQ